MRKAFSVLKKFTVSLISLILVLQMGMGFALATTSVQSSDDETAEITSQTSTQPKIRFDMETLEDGKVIEVISGTRYDVNGTAVLTDGPQGEKALALNGVDNYINIGSVFQPKNAYTIMAWVKQAPNPPDWQAIVFRGNSGKKDNTFGIKMRDTRVYHALAVGSSNSTLKEIFSPDAAVVPNEWNHIAVTRQSETVTIYVDGELVHTAEVPGGDFVETDFPMYIGIDCNSAGVPYSAHALKGALDDVRLYDVALSADEIKAIYLSATEFSIVENETENGKLVLDFLQKPSNVQEEEIVVSAQMSGASIGINVTGFDYNPETGLAVIEFEPFENKSAVDRTVVLSVTYKTITLKTSIVVPGNPNTPPIVENLRIENLSTSMLGEKPRVKGMLEAKYTFVDADGDKEGKTKFQWQIADSPDGEFEDILGLHSQTVILLDEYVGKYLRCKVTPVDEYGNVGEEYFTPSTEDPVEPTEGNPLTDWFYEAGFGLSHHFLSNYFNLPHVYTSPEEKWDRSKMTWNEFVGQFDVESYAKQVNDIGAKFVIFTLGQNSGYYCAPNPVYDKYLREVGLLGENEPNPKTTSFENDLPMRLADALAKYGIKLMLYLPSNPPHSASWDESGTPDMYGYYPDKLVTKLVFDYTPGYDGVPNQRARMVHNEMVEWWSRHYGDKIVGWWFDGFYSNIEQGQTDMTQQYNISTLANAAKAGNPYSIITFNRGTGAKAYTKSSKYTDYTAGENPGLTVYHVDGRWAEGTTDCQNFTFGPLGNRNNWSNGWGCSGVQFQDVNHIVNTAQTIINKGYVLAFDVRVNVFGEIDPQQYAQLKEVKKVVDKTPPDAPVNLRAENLEGTAINLKWDASKNESGNLKGYNIYRNGNFLVFTEDTDYIDETAAENTSYTYYVKAVNYRNVESEPTNEVTIITGWDTIPPKLISGRVIGTTEVSLVFDKAVTKESAEMISNYDISDGTVTEAKLQDDGKTVVLTVEDLLIERPFIIYVKGVKDTSSAGNECNASIQVSAVTGYYKFDEDDLNIAFDSIGNNHGQKTNVSISEEGINGKAAVFSGNSRVAISKDVLYGMKDWTFSAWINWDGTTSESQTILGNAISNDPTASGMWLHIRSDRKLWAAPFDGRTGSEISFASSETVPANQWVHVALVFKDGTFIMYLNGEETARREFANYPSDIENTVNLGCNINNVGNIIHRYNGLMDEVKFYSIALNAEQIKALAEQTEFLPYVIGNTFTFDPNNPSDIMIRIDANEYTLSNIIIDGAKLTEEDYNIVGSTVTIKESYLKSLKSGNYSLAFTFTKDGADDIMIDDLSIVVLAKDLTITVDVDESIGKLVYYPLNPKVGDIVTVGVKLLKEGYILEEGSLKYNNVVIEKKNGEYVFIMPDEDVVLTANFIIDKSELKELIGLCVLLKKEDYTEESWMSFERALTAAQEILAKEDATVAEVKLAQADLWNEYMNLQKRIPVDKSALYEALKKGKLILDNIDDYIPETVTGFEEIYNRGKAVYDDPNTTQEKVDRIVGELEKAIERVKLKQPKEETEPDDKPSEVKTGDYMMPMFMLMLSIMSLSVISYTLAALARKKMAKNRETCRLE